MVRLSGPGAPAALERLSGRCPEPRRASLVTLRAADGAVLDRALVLRFLPQASFTGEAVVELHLHGGRAVVAAVLDTLARIDGLRLAEPGEFTRRALENGRLDLTEVEGLADLIDAETEAQRRQAMRLLSGALGARAERWRTALIRAMALIEATIDFADEEVPVDVTPEVTALLDEVQAAIGAEIAGQAAAERIRDGFEVAIVGPPNVGKSTLLNSLAGREAALTSEIAGTTRDVIEVRMDLGGLPVTFLDTAGLRDTDDRVEAMGVSRAIERARHADLRVFLTEPDVALELAPMAGDIVVGAKADLYPDRSRGVSGKTGQGVRALVEEVQARLSERSAGAGLAVSQRHRAALEAAERALTEARRAVALGPDHVELAAEHLRDAVHRLDSLVGRVDVEHVLDEIFRSFCLGK